MSGSAPAPPATQSHRVFLVRLVGLEVLYVDADHGAGHDRRFLEVLPVATAAELGMQVVPGGDVHSAVAAVGGDLFVVGSRPGLWLGAFAALAVASGPPDRFGGAGRWFGWSGVEHPVITDPDYQDGSDLGQFVGQRDRVVPGVEDERRGGRAPRLWLFAELFAWLFAWLFAELFAWLFAEPGDQATDLSCGGGHGVGSRWNPVSVHRRGP